MKEERWKKKNDVDFAKTSRGRYAARPLIGCNLRASRDAISCFLCFGPTLSPFESLSKLSV